MTQYIVQFADSRGNVSSVRLQLTYFLSVKLLKTFIWKLQSGLPSITSDLLSGSFLVSCPGTLKGFPFSIPNVEIQQQKSGYRWSYILSKRALNLRLLHLNLVIPFVVQATRYFTLILSVLKFFSPAIIQLAIYSSAF